MLVLYLGELLISVMSSLTHSMQKTQHINVILRSYSAETERTQGKF